MVSSLVSVIIPCYNQAGFLKDAVNCVIDQSYKEWECIIVNDGSTDDTHEVAMQLLTKDNRLKYYKKQNGGLASARNAGLEKALGTYIQFLDADDIIKEEKLFLSIEAFSKSPDSDLVISEFVMHHMDEGKYVLPVVKLSEIELTFAFLLLNWDPYGFNFPIHSPIYKADLAKKFGFREDFKAVEDLIFHLQVFKSIKKYVVINQPLAVYRKHQTNMTGNRSHMVKNFISAYDFMIDHLVDDELKVDFFKKINRVWGNQALTLLTDLQTISNKQTEIINSTSYRIGNGIISPIIALKKLVSKL